jgi:hypothetical protein
MLCADRKIKTGVSGRCNDPGQRNAGTDQGTHPDCCGGVPCDDIATIILLGLHQSLQATTATGSSRTPARRGSSEAELRKVRRFWHFVSTGYLMLVSPVVCIIVYQSDEDEGDGRRAVALEGG